MEQLQLPSITILLPSLLFLFFLIKRGFAAKSKSLQYPKLPPGPWKLPIIGNIHHLAGRLPFRAFRELARKHGPLMLLKIGEIYVVVASSREAAVEILKNQDLNFAFRPELSVANVGYGCCDIGLSPYGPYWKQLRKLCFMELLSTKRIRSYSALRKEEILNLLAYISETKTPINLTEKLSIMSNNIVARAAFGKRNKQQERFIMISNEIVELASGFSFADTFPSLKFLDILTGNTFRTSRMHRTIDEILEEIIKEHRAKPKTNLKDKKADEVEDLVDVLLRIKDDPELEIPMTMDNIKSVILDMFIGGTETSSNVIEWAMSELVRNPKTLAKAQKEVREALKGKTMVEESDVAELSYLKLVIKETLRLHPPLPLLIPRVCKGTCEVLGYRVETGTWVFINAWAINRDLQYWEDAESFKPERFEGNSIDFKGNNFEYLPFGAGRRICPGMGFGSATVDLALALLLFYFDWKMPGGMKPEELDMTETFGVTAGRKTKLKLLAVPRFPVPAAVIT